MRTGDGTDAGQLLTDWVERYADALRGYIWTLLDDKPAVEDILQEVFLRAWRSRDRYIQSGREKAYLFRIADRLVLDRWRAAARTGHEVRELDVDVPDPAADEPLDWIQRQETRRLLEEALSQLSDAQKRTLLLRYFGQLSFEEIAGALGCPLGTALSHAHRGIDRLRRILVPEADR